MLSNTPTPLDIERERPYLMRFAALQLRNSDAAEDSVQETLAAALAGRERFSGKSSLRTWLTGILKHKVIDHVRKQAREQPIISGGDTERSEADAIDSLFLADGHWREPPSDWGDPHKALQNKAFLAAFEQCAKNLPEKTARVFMMREVLEESTEDICKELKVTSTNCWVMLHRARMSLRECLQTKWFGAQP